MNINRQEVGEKSSCDKRTEAAVEKAHKKSRKRNLLWAAAEEISVDAAVLSEMDGIFNKNVTEDLFSVDNMLSLYPWLVLAGV